MAPNIALAILADIKKPLRVLDPMMGSGTVLLLQPLSSARSSRACQGQPDDCNPIAGSRWPGLEFTYKGVESCDRGSVWVSLGGGA